eukprot:TRINITY_DN22528_c0_g1_i1.p1 TRINITY_DN22528_c0_g1~~TRINITY_DN22528_c0_g1_i1.p1  ORF type:complete len:581 (-),score=115.28 TRINITY_DN22528_c0_g1_i1:447-2189(-)
MPMEGEESWPLVEESGRSCHAAVTGSGMSHEAVQHHELAGGVLRPAGAKRAFAVLVALATVGSVYRSIGGTSWIDSATGSSRRPREARSSEYTEAAEAPPSPTRHVNIMTWNMACRGFGMFKKCDNCEQRFQQIARAIDGESGFSGVPDFASLDVIMAQEVFIEDFDDELKKQTIDLVDAALEKKGFKRLAASTGSRPLDTDPICNVTIYPHWVQQHIPDFLDQPNGGLVMWTKLEVLGFRARRWCKNIFPGPQGYTVAHLRKDGVNIFAFNSHMAPEVTIGPLQAEGVRAMQFAELAAEAKTLSAAFEGSPYAITFSGDTNEDAYHLSNTKPNPACEDLGEAETLRSRLAAVGITDITAKCKEGLFGAPTWDIVHNDIARRFSTTGKIQVLDYISIIQASQATGMPINNVHRFEKTGGWRGQFCATPATAAGCCEEVLAHALSDHYPVTAAVPLPAARMTGQGNAQAAFQSAVQSFDPAPFSCGQEGTQCLPMPGFCCEDPRHALDGKPKSCWMGKCTTCKAEGGQCIFDTDCCGFHNASDSSLHCYYNTCTAKRRKGESCMTGSSCSSGHCSWFTGCQ